MVVYLLAARPQINKITGKCKDAVLFTARSLTQTTWVADFLFADWNVRPRSVFVRT